MKIVFRSIWFLLILFTLLVGYLSFIGIETNKLNDQIEKKVKNIDQNLIIELKQIKIILEPLNFQISAKTIGPKLKIKNKVVELQSIKTQISLKSLIQDNFALKNLEISTKSLKVKNLISFLRSIKDSSELYVLEKIINEGYIIGDVKLEFDEEGNIKNNYNINGFVKNIDFNILNKYDLKNFNLDFNFEKKQLVAKNISFILNDLNLNSDKISIKQIKDEFFIDTIIYHKKFLFLKEEINLLIKPFLKNIDFEKIQFSSKNFVSFRLNKKFRIKDFKINSKIELDELQFKNNLDLKKYFPKIQKEIYFINHKLEIVYNSDSLTINGNGDFLLQEKKDNLSYNFEKKGKIYNFSSLIKIKDNDLNVGILNFSKQKNSELKIELDGNKNKKDQVLIDKFKLIENDNIIEIKDLELDKSYKVLNFKNIKLDYSDNQNLRNSLKAYSKNKQYFLEGSFFNAKKLIENTLNSDKKKSRLFHFSNNFNINIDEVALDKVYSLNNLVGNLTFKNQNILNAKISGKFSDYEKLIFTIETKDNNKVTTLFLDTAEPIVKRFDFIKGFDGGKLDFSSTRNGKTSFSKLKIYDFKLKELPVLTKILTLASLQGIADILSGEGIRFDEFEMNFENNQNLMTIKEIYAIGPALSILMEGYVEKNKLVSLRGTLVPATTINKFIGSLPVLGEILVGKKTGEGVFGVSFKIKGPPKKLETSVNPIKTLTPRFITRTLEKIKKN